MLGKLRHSTGQRRMICMNNFGASLIRLSIKLNFTRNDITMTRPACEGVTWRSSRIIFFLKSVWIAIESWSSDTITAILDTDCDANKPNLLSCSDFNIRSSLFTIHRILLFSSPSLPVSLCACDRRKNSDLSLLPIITS